MEFRKAGTRYFHIEYRIYGKGIRIGNVGISLSTDNGVFFGQVRQKESLLRQLSEQGYVEKYGKLDAEMLFFHEFGNKADWLAFQGKASGEGDGLSESGTESEQKTG